MTNFTPESTRITAGELHLRLLEQFAPPSIVVTEEHTLVHVSEKAGRFLHVAGGEPSRDVASRSPSSCTRSAGNDRARSGGARRCSAALNLQPQGARR